MTDHDERTPGEYPTLPKKGDKRFRVWFGGLSRTISAGWMTYDGHRWVSKGEKHEVTEDALVAAENAEGWQALAADFWNALENLRSLWEGTERAHEPERLIAEYEAKAGLS